MHSRSARALGVSVAASAAFLAPALALAQLAGPTGTVGQPFTISVAPNYPVPLGKAALTLLSSELDLTNATVSVTVGGKNVYEGGAGPIPLQLGKAGVVVSATVTVTTQGKRYSRTVRIQPQDVALVAEPVASAPPLYAGKPLIPLEGSTRIVAVAGFRDAQGKAFDPSALSYAWTVDGTLLAASSGIGRQAIVVTSPLQYRERTVSIAVQSQDGTLVGGAALALSPVQPIVRIYETDPLLGIRFDRALAGTYPITGAEDTFYAAPFSFPTTGGAPSLQWFLNGKAAQTGSEITLRPAGSGQGDASLSVVASAGSYTTASQNLSLTFGSTRGFNLFGL